MRLLSWNIQHGGGTRIPRIVDAIAAHGPDVIALSEFRQNPGALICTALAAQGWQYIESTCPTGSDNGVCVLSRTPLRRTRPCPAPPENLVRWLDVELPEYGFGLGALHILCTVPGMKDVVRGSAKARFWDAVLLEAQARLHEPFLFVGDWNTGLRSIDESGKAFVCAEHFAKLSASGWTDIWRHQNPGITEWT